MEEQMNRRLRAFERDHGKELIALASHAAMPVVMDPEVLHLIRINYFIDPPYTLPYGAEATLLLSPLCTEIDDGMYAMDPELRDLLLKRLVTDFGGARVRDMARLLWEYCGRGAPWSGSPGLMEAQQLTAMNFIDAPRALAWLERAARGEGSVPVDDRRWFVALEQDLKGRAAALRDAEGDATSPAADLPALKGLHDALMRMFSDARPAGVFVETLNLQMPKGWQRESPSRQWRTILDVAWHGGVMARLFAAVQAYPNTVSEQWLKACQTYWSHLTPALRIEQGRIATVPPEWQVLERQRAVVESAIRAALLIYQESPGRPLAFRGMGALVGDDAVLTHASLVSDAIDGSGALIPGHRILAAFFKDHPRLTDEPEQSANARIELTAGRLEKHGCAVLTLAPKVDRAALPLPLRLARDPRLASEGRKIFVLGYPMSDSRNDPELAALIFGDSLGVARLQPGEILKEDKSKAIISHNCYTAGGNGGSPLVDVETGLVLGVHLGSNQAETVTRGLKVGQAISIARLRKNRALRSSGAFATPEHKKIELRYPWLSTEGIFVNRIMEQARFEELLKSRRGHVLRIEGPAGIGKTALMKQLAELAVRHDLRLAYLSRVGSHDHLFHDIADQIETVDSVPAADELSERRFQQILFGQPTAVFIDGLDKLTLNESRTVLQLEQLVLESSAHVILVLGGRDLRRVSEPFKEIYEWRLGALDVAAVEDWISAAGIESNAELSSRIRQAGGVPALINFLIEESRAVVPPKPLGPDPATSLDEELLPTVEVIDPSGAGICILDDASETHGPFVRTRGKHVLTVPPHFRIGTYPVTNGVFYQFVRAGGYENQRYWPRTSHSTRLKFLCHDGTPGPGSWQSSQGYNELFDVPVTGICYLEAHALVTWLNLANRAPAGARWCLPSEDMWEFAARGAAGLLYPWGSEFGVGRCNSKEEGLDKPSQPGLFPGGRSVFGAEDMSGNVWEFVDIPHGDGDGCVLRGGSYKNTRDEVKASLRLVDVPLDHRPLDFGMRCALVSMQ